MVVLVACGDKSINEHFSVKIVEEGIEPHKAINKEELFSKLDDKNIDVIVLDLDSDKYDGINTIKEIKIDHNIIPIIVLTYKTGMEFARSMADIGVHGFVSKIEDFEMQITKTLDLLDSIKTKKKENRKYIRVKPNENDRNEFTMHINGIERGYSGKIKDISLGGIAASLSKEVLDSLLYPGIMVNIEFSLNKMTTFSSAKVVARRGNDIAVSFRDMPSATRKKISEYILSTIK